MKNRQNVLEAIAECLYMGLIVASVWGTMILYWIDFEINGQGPRRGKGRAD